MAENKTKQSAASVSGFINTITDDARRADAKALVKLMQEATRERPKLWGPSIIGFGSYHYKYESGREGDMPVTGFSPRKSAMVLYGITQFEGAGQRLERLGIHTMGKGCLYIKKLADVDVEVLRTMISEAAAHRKQPR